MQVIFNSLNLNDQVNYFVEDVPHEVTAKPELNLQKIARSNASVLLRKGYGTKTITLDLIVSDSSVANLDTRLDTVKKAVEASANLDIDYGASTRRYVCTGFVDSVERHPTYARLKIHFEVYVAFGQDVSATTVSFNGKTTTPYNDTIAIGGSAPAQPTITITINSFTGASTRSVILTNVTTGDYVQLDRTDWANGDVIAIDCVSQTVTKNGVKVQYLGIMPVWNPATISWRYSDTFTARNVNVVFSYNKKYL